MFVRKYTYEQIRHEFSVDIEISDEPIADMFSFCREVLIIDLAHQHTTRGKIGGNGCVVQVDEMKFGKRKHNVGRIVDGSWIFGAIDDETNELRIEVCTENQRSSEVLHSLILKQVEVGTEIRSDCWRGSLNLEKHGYFHATVNHSENFVNPDTGVHTQKIESN